MFLFSSFRANVPSFFLKPAGILNVWTDLKSVGSERVKVQLEALEHHFSVVMATSQRVSLPGQRQDTDVPRGRVCPGQRCFLGVA